MLRIRLHRSTLAHQPVPRKPPMLQFEQMLLRFGLVELPELADICDLLILFLVC